MTGVPGAAVDEIKYAVAPLHRSQSETRAELLEKYSEVGLYSVGPVTVYFVYH